MEFFFFFWRILLDGVKASIWLPHMDWLVSKAFVCHGSSPVVNIGQSLNSKEIYTWLNYDIGRFLSILDPKIFYFILGILLNSRISNQPRRPSPIRFSDLVRLSVRLGTIYLTDN